MPWLTGITTKALAKQLKNEGTDVITDLNEIKQFFASWKDDEEPDDTLTWVTIDLNDTEIEQVIAILQNTARN